MAKYLSFNPKIIDVQEIDAQAEALRKKVEAAPLENAAAVLKAYRLLDAAEKHGILDILRGAISAEDTIIDKVAGYANTPEGIRTLRNLLVLGKFFGSIDPDLLKAASADLTTSVTQETRRPAAGFFATTRRIFNGDAVRGLGIAIAGLESLGRTARLESEKSGEGKRR